MLKIFRLQPRQWKPRRWNYGTIAGLAIVLTGLTALTGCGSAPESAPEEVSESPAPVAPVTVTAEEVQNYAKVVLEIEPIRLVSLGRVQTLLESGAAPIIACHQPNSLVGLSNEVLEVVVNFCTQAREIGASYGFTATRFNAITNNVPNNPTLQEQITQALLQEQIGEN